MQIWLDSQEKFPPGKGPIRKSSHPEVPTWKSSHPKSSNGGKVPTLKKKFFFHTKFIFKYRDMQNYIQVKPPLLKHIYTEYTKEYRG